MITNATNNNFPFPFNLQYTFLRSFVSGNVLSSNSDIKQPVSISKAAARLKKKLKILDTNKIDFISRFKAFISLHKHLHLWESKYLSNFSGTAHMMAQQSLWRSDLFRCCNEESERDT